MDLRKISIEEIKKKPFFPKRISREINSEVLKIDPLKIIGSIKVSLILKGLKGRDDIINLSGKIKVTATLECTRCLKYFNYPLNIMVSNNFVEEGEIAEGCVELKRDNLTNLYFRGEYLDLLENIREEILLNIPDYPMCQEDCLGLCSICGMDLNDKACHCKDKKEGPFRMLKKLINQEEN